jgi:1-acyl-sn-glycerol-3-phosphate acyltransferase
VIALLALAASLLACPAKAAVVAAEPAASLSFHAAPSPLPSFAAAPLLSAPALSPPAPVAAPSLSAAPAPVPALSPVASPAAAPALSAAPAAAAPAARAALSQAALPAPEAAAAAFDGGARRALDASPASAPSEGRPAVRLQLLSAEELGLDPAKPEAPRPPSAEPQPFLNRHYRLARAVVLPFLKLFYRVDVSGLENLPADPMLIVPNHVSFLDPVLISVAANRPMRYLMSRAIYETRGLQWLFRSLGAIPISPKDPKPVIEESLNRVRRALAASQSVVIFPEGQLSRDGQFSPFRRGFERAALGLDVPVVPARIDGMWGSVLSRHPDRGWRRSLRARLAGRRRTSVRFGAALPRADAGLAREAIARLAPGAPPAPILRAGGRDFLLIERRGKDRFGKDIVLLDALDARDPGAGTAAHIDFTAGGGSAGLDEPLDLSSTVRMPHPAAAPPGADLSHQTRRHLWFGLAVRPEYRNLGLGAALMDAAVERMRAAGATRLFIRATESSRGFYLKRFGKDVVAVEAETDREGETYYRLEVRLAPETARR